MQDNNGNYIFFSNIGKKFKDSKEIKLKHKKIYIKKYFETSEYNDNFAPEIFLKKNNIFDNDNQNNKSKEKPKKNNKRLMEKVNNKYKYHDLHIRKLKKLKMLKSLKNQKINQQIYEPNIDYIKKRIIFGPKWEFMTGRQKESNLNNNQENYSKSKREEIFVNNSFAHKTNNIFMNFDNNNNSNKTFRGNISLNKKKILNYNRNYSSKPTNIKINLKRKIKNNVLNNSDIIDINISKLKETKRGKNLNTVSPKSDKKIIIRNISMINCTNIPLPKEHYLDNMIINDKLLKMLMLPSSLIPYKKKNNKKIFKIKPKNYKNNFVGINSEQLKVIRDYQKDKKLNSMKKITEFSKTNIKDKILSINPKDKMSQSFENNNLGMKSYYNYSDESMIKKSFNYFVNKSLLKYKDNKSKSNKNFDDCEGKSFIYNLKSNEFFKFNIDKINNYSFNKFDNVTYKTLTN